MTDVGPVAAALNESLRRPTDQLARWGGEEFLAALPDTPAAGARTVALGMRERVAALGITTQPPDDQSQ